MDLKIHLQPLGTQSTLENNDWQLSDLEHNENTVFDVWNDYRYCRSGFTFINGGGGH